MDLNNNHFKANDSLVAKNRMLSAYPAFIVYATRCGDGISHVLIECNDGLVINADWKRNAFNEYGYDIYKPKVNITTNQLEVMLTARSVIASYLKGEYD